MSNEKTEPTKGQQEQAQPTTQQTPAAQPATTKAPAKGQQQPTPTKAAAPTASGKSAPATSKAPAPKPTPPAPKAATPVAPVLVMRSDPAVFDTNNVKALYEKRVKLVEEEIELRAKLTRNYLSQQQVAEKLRFLLSPSPIFAEGAIPGSEFLTGRMDALMDAVSTVKALVNDKPSEHEVALQVERTLGPRLDALGEANRSVLEAAARPLLSAPDDDPDAVNEQIEAAELADEEGQQSEQDEEVEGLFDPEEDEEEPVLALPDMDWTDAYEVEGAPNMEALPLDVLTLDGVGQLTFVVVPNEASSHISAFGAELARKDGEERACVYVRFKQAPKVQGQPWRVSAIYRYSVLHANKWATLVDIATRRIGGDESVPSIGAFIENEIKALHEKGVIGCQKLDPSTGTWVNAQTRAERKAAKSVTAAPAAPAATAKSTGIVARPAQPRTVTPATRINTGLGDAMRAAAARPTAPAQAGGDPLDESFM